MPNLLETIKTAALDAVAATNPTAIVFGTVISVNPLRINIEQRLTIPANHLILSSLVRDFNVDMTFDYSTESRSGGSGESSFASHDHDVVGKKAVTIHLGLKLNEKVMLLRVQGGQKFIVLDRVR